MLQFQKSAAAKIIMCQYQCKTALTTASVWQLKLPLYTIDFSVKNDQVLRVGLPVKESHEDRWVVDMVYCRIKEDVRIFAGVFGWRYFHAAVTDCVFSRENSNQVDVLVSIGIWLRIGPSSGVGGISCKVAALAIDSCCRNKSNTASTVSIITTPRLGWQWVLHCRTCWYSGKSW